MEEKLKEKYKIAKMIRIQLSQEYSKKPTKVLKEKDLDLIEAEFFKYSERYRRNLLSIYSDICKKEVTTIQNKEIREKLSELKYLLPPPIISASSFSICSPVLTRSFA